jgi:hypothetical protein
VTWRIAVDIGWRIAYKRLVPQRGSDNGGIKSHGEETQEGQENRIEKGAQGEVGVLTGTFPRRPRPVNRARKSRRAACDFAGSPPLLE